MDTGRWRSVVVAPQTVFGLLAKDLAMMGQKYANGLPDLRATKNLLIGADYSGEDGKAPCVVYSLLMTSIEAWAEWEPKRLQVRRTHFSDSRRMSFKKLSDKQRAQALLPILNAADSLDGLIFSIAISKQCPSVFSASPPLDLRNPQFAAYRKWKPSVLDKAFLILHLSGLLIGGLAEAGQDLLWFTDEDSIAANDQRVSELTQLFAWISSLYLSFEMGRCRCGTSRCDNGTLQIEDFLAIPDLVAGALSEQFAINANSPPMPSGVFWVQRGDFSEKTQRITWWFADAGQALKRLVCVVDPTEDGTAHKVSWYHFHNQQP
jgi:hypothetical protein